TQQLATGDKTMIPLAGPANKQGRICADNIAGDHKSYRGSLGTSVAKVFDLDVAAVGVNEKTLKAAGKVKGTDYETVLLEQKSHAGYYPGATPMAIKVIFDLKGNIYGAQIVGQDGVDKRIDTIATTMKLHGTIHDLAELELSYAPPFSSAKDPVNMAGFVAENVLDNMISLIEWNEVDELLLGNRTDYIILDVTEDVERMVFAMPNSYHIPLGQLYTRFQELDPNKLIITYCAIGVRSYNAARILQGKGLKQVKVLSGGSVFYKSMHHMDQWNMQEPMMKAAEIQSTAEEIKEASEREEDARKTKEEIRNVDCNGLQCPGPIMKVHESIKEMKEGETLKVCATDMGFARDIEAWCRRTGNTLIKTERKEKENIVWIQKGITSSSIQDNQEQGNHELPQGKTIVVFSGDLDKVLASFIIANGAASMGRPVTMFFTFWGLNALRKSEKIKIKKPIIEKMFGAMMPRGSKKLKLSKMNMAGMGTAMMKQVMGDKNVDSLEDLMKHAMENGVKLVACTMSMDIMGITKEELLDGVEYAGVASYLGDAEESNVNLFV
ncbi:MAG: DsrE/DsrF/DrsH-like family protein, partial [Lachnospiraceae bacterium]